MKKEAQPVSAQRDETVQETPPTPELTPESRSKLSYVTPTLKEHGKVEALTQTFFGSFSP